MKQHNLVAEQFGSTASAYATSTVHAQGEDLKRLRSMAEQCAQARVLDLGCGAGHASFAVAPVAASVTAYDLSAQMLAAVEQGARERKLDNIRTEQGAVERLPFPNAAFDLVMTRFSAHHWLDVPGALTEIKRVLTENGRAVLIDIVSPETPLHDTTLQAVELLRDASHVRDFRMSEWSAMLDAAGFEHSCSARWRLPMVFHEWIARMRTPTERETAIKSLFERAPEEVRRYFEVQPDYSFSIDAALFEARKMPPT